MAIGHVDILGRVPAEYDAIIVGGGHNGLVTAAYLGRAGLTTLVLERRAVLGGAAVSEHPWPGYTVSTLSYVLSLMPPEVINELCESDMVTAPQRNAVHLHA